MANTIHFRRALCPAVGPIGFEHQLDVYLRESERSASSTLTLGKIATANVGIIDGMLMADFHLNDDMFSQPEEIVVVSVVANGAPQASMGESTALQLSAMIVERRWPVPTPVESPLPPEA
jgi:hypothetical protein